VDDNRKVYDITFRVLRDGQWKDARHPQK